MTDDWASSSCKEIQGIKEAVGNVIMSMQEFGESQQVKCEVSALQASRQSMNASIVLQRDTASVASDISELKSSADKFKVLPLRVYKQ